MGCMGSLDEISCENPETSFQIPDTSQTYIITDSPFFEPFPFGHKKTPQHGVRRVFWVVMSEGCPHVTSDKHIFSLRCLKQKSLVE